MFGDVACVHCSRTDDSQGVSQEALSVQASDQIKSNLFAKRGFTHPWLLLNVFDQVFDSACLLSLHARAFKDMPRRHGNGHVGGAFPNRKAPINACVFKRYLGGKCVV